MSTFALKIIACICMLIDHITAVFVDQHAGYLFHLVLGSYEMDVTVYVIGRVIGRIAFPLFAFLIVQGFMHTQNLKKYMLRLAAFALISEIPYDFAFWEFPNISLCILRQNVFFTLLAGLITISLIDMIVKQYQQKPWLMNLLQVLVIVAACLLLFLIQADYASLGYGILIMVGFYVGRYRKFSSVLIFVLLTGFLCPNLQFMAILAAPFIYFYNGMKGPSLRYAFYAFYPVHLVIIGLIEMAIN